MTVINIESLKNNKAYYSEDDFPPCTFENLSNDLPLESIAQGEFKNRKYRVLTFGIRENLFWSVSKGFIVVLLATLSVGLALLIKPVQNLWHEARAGRAFKQLKVLKNEQPSIQKTAEIAPQVINQPKKEENLLRSDPLSTQQNLPQTINPTTETSPTPKSSSQVTEQPKTDDLFAKLAKQKQEEYRRQMEYMFNPQARDLEKHHETIEKIKKLSKEEVQALNLSNFDSGLLKVEILILLARRTAGPDEKRVIELFTNDQIGKIPFSKWDLKEVVKYRGEEKYQLFFNLLFKDPSKLAAVQINELPSILPFIKAKLKHLTKKQVESLDFSEKGCITQDVLIAMGNLDDPTENKRGEILKWLTKDQIAQINFSNWPLSPANKTLIKFLFSDISKISSIPNSMIPLMFPFFDSEQLKGLTKEQVQSLDFSDDYHNFRQRYLTALAGLNEKEEAQRGKMITWLKPEQILASMKKTNLTKEIAKFITGEQISQIDFKETLSDKNLSIYEKNQLKESINALFSESSKVAFISSDMMNTLVNWIDPSKLKDLTKEQVQKLENLSPSLLLGIANLKDENIDKRGQLLKALTGDQIILAINKGFLSENLAFYLTADQIALIDFTKLSPSINQKVLDPIFNDDSKVSKIQIGSLPKLIPMIDSNKLKGLTKEQIESLDFASNSFMTRSILRGMTNLRDTAKRGQCIQWMTAEQVQYLLEKKYFDTETSPFITKEQLKKIPEHCLTGFGNLIKRKRSGK